jgi:hypothetical protein
MPASQSRSDPDETSGQKLEVCRKFGWLALVTYHLFSHGKDIPAEISKSF